MEKSQCSLRSNMEIKAVEDQNLYFRNSMCAVPQPDSRWQYKTDQKLARYSLKLHLLTLRMRGLAR